MNYAQVSSHFVDFYLDEARKDDYDEIVRLSKNNDAESAELLRGHVCEALRLCSPIMLYLGDLIVHIEQV